MDAYKEAGFDVHLEPLPEKPTCESCEVSEDADACRVCFEGFEEFYKIIYTRPQKERSESKDDFQLKHGRETGYEE